MTTLVIEHVEELQNKAKLITYLNDLIESDDFIKPKFFGKDEVIKTEVQDKIKDFLRDYLQEVINGTKKEPVETLSQEDILIVKEFVKAIRAKTGKNDHSLDGMRYTTQNLSRSLKIPNKPLGPVLDCKAVESGQDDRAIFGKSDAVESQPEGPKSRIRKAQLPDVTYITTRHGTSLPNIYNDMLIDIVGEEGDQYIGQLIQQPGVQFHVPKDIIDL